MPSERIERSRNLDQVCCNAVMRRIKGWKWDGDTDRVRISWSRKDYIFKSISTAS